MGTDLASRTSGSSSFSFRHGRQCSSAVEQRFRKPSVAGSIPAIGSSPNWRFSNRLRGIGGEVPVKLPVKRVRENEFVTIRHFRP